MLKDFFSTLFKSFAIIVAVIFTVFLIGTAGRLIWERTHKPHTTKPSIVVKTPGAKIEVGQPRIEYGYKVIPVKTTSPKGDVVEGEVKDVYTKPVPTYLGYYRASSTEYIGITRPLLQYQGINLETGIMIGRNVDTKDWDGGITLMLAKELDPAWSIGAGCCYQFDKGGIWLLGIRYSF